MNRKKIDMNDIEEVQGKDLEGKNINTIKVDTITNQTRKLIHSFLGLGAGAPTKFEKLARVEVLDAVTKNLESHLSEHGMITQDNLTVLINDTIKEVLTDSTIERLKLETQSARKAVKKADESGYDPDNPDEEGTSDTEDAIPVKKKKVGKPKKGPNIDELFISFPASILNSDDIITMSMNKLTKRDILAIYAKQLPSKKEAAELVSFYYQLQKIRIALQGIQRASYEAGDSCHTISVFFNEFYEFESQVKTALNAYTDNDPIGWTLKQVTGVGPVIAAGIISNFDVTKAKTAGGFMRYCGYDPTLPPPKKGEKLTYSRDLKILMIYKLGESFVKVQNKDSDVYGHIYAKWKELYQWRNEHGEYAEEAKRQLESKKWKATDSDVYNALKAGKLPDIQIHSRARRKPIGIFINHLFDLMYMHTFHCSPPRPYVYEYDKHEHNDWVENPFIEIYESRYGKLDLSQGSPYPYKRNYGKEIQPGDSMLPPNA